MTTVNQLLIQTGITFVAAAMGAVFGAFLTRRTERFKHLQEPRSAAYVDFLRGFAKIGRAQSDTMRDERSRLEELEGRVIVTDARSRIAIYGSEEVVRSFSHFTRVGTQSRTDEGMKAFAALCAMMRSEAGQEGASADDIKAVLYD